MPPCARASSFGSRFMSSAVRATMRRMPRLADRQVVRLLGQHEAAGARERVEARLGERRELVLAVAVGERGEAEEVEPGGDRAVERAEDARVVGLAALRARAAPRPPRGRRGRSG